MMRPLVPITVNSVDAPMINLIVPGDPKAKGRPRFRAAQGGYTDAKTRTAEKQLRAAFVDAYPAWAPLRGRLRIEVLLYRRTRHHVDTDNLLKLVKDSLNGVAWVDDEQIDDERAARAYGLGDQARTELKVWVLS